MTFRTPIPQFIAIDFMNDGEILNATNLNDRMLHKLDDKAEFLRSNLDIEVVKSTRIADLVGEDYDGIDVTPCWATNHNYLATDTHHLAIEGLDANLSRVDLASTDQTNRLNNNDVYVGEDSNTAGTPTWLSPNAFALTSSHHAAIQALDTYAKANRDSIDSLDTGQDTLDAQMLVRINEIGLLNIDVGALQTFTGQTGGAGHASTLVVHASQLSALDLFTTSGPLGAQVATNVIDIAALEAVDIIHNSDILALEAVDVVHNSDIAVLESKIDTIFPILTPGSHASKIATLESKLVVQEALDVRYQSILNAAHGPFIPVLP